MHSLNTNLSRLTIVNLRHIVAFTQEDEVLKEARRELARRLWNVRRHRQVNKR